MKTAEVKFSISLFDSIDELNKEDALLLREARKVTQYAYAPYSNFNVGAFAKLENGKTVSGTNQENASFPAGICAERTLLSTASSLFPGVGIDTIAISYNNLDGKSDRPVSPCGICRQSLVEFQDRTKKQIRVILSGMEGEVQIIENAKDLLPLVFGADDMK
ncbi:cytidine deaminase [Ginsengibacter hankyongi]|uniref:Cytidine deaminase n=1 Tax=Ginsengibacter hankyongi TaxID=2607284 RepID=A0A5J5IFG9_9BACT|nr:cytidine deaminase [Ginsengibacter hankyongi]KAA9037735.1 cytidine deaminase [Ginsengibacter hankyongi]